MKKLVIIFLITAFTMPACATRKYSVVELPAHRQRYSYIWSPGARTFAWQTRGGLQHKVNIPENIEAVAPNGKITALKNKNHLHR